MKFEDMIPIGKKGDYSVRKFNEEIHLMHKEQSWISTSVWELGTHDELKEKAKGDVLLAGLGLGYDVWMLKDNLDVKSVTVVEFEQDVIDLVWEHIKNPKSKIVHDRILNYLKTTDKRFDTIWFDIFPNDPFYYPEETKILLNVASHRLNIDGITLFWKCKEKVIL